MEKKDIRLLILACIGWSLILSALLYKDQLYFFAWIGSGMLIYVIYRVRKISTKVMAIGSLMLISTAAFQPTYAMIYTGKDENHLVQPRVRLYVAYDTATKKLSFNWDGADVNLFPPGIFSRLTSSLVVKDTAGFKWRETMQTPKGAKTIVYYSYSDTWLTVKAQWCYTIWFYWVFPECKVKLWIPKTTVQWDLNSDGICDLTDLYIIFSMYGTANPKGDFNGNGVVDMIDIIQVCQHLGEIY